MRLAAFAFAFLALVFARPATADVTVRVSKSEQLMRVYVGEQLTYQFRSQPPPKVTRRP